MSVPCTACGSMLEEGARFCAHCGTANEPTEAPTPLIDEAPLSSSSGLTTVTTGRKIDAKAMPIVVGQHTTLEGADRAVKPEPVPWAEPRADRPGPRAFEPTPMRGRERIGVVLLVVAALLVVPAIGSFWTFQTLHDPVKFSSLFGDLNRRPEVVGPLGRRVADDLVAKRFVKPSARAEAAGKATKFMESRAFDKSWGTALRATQAQAVAVVGGSGDVIELDLTPVVDHLRYDGVAESNATMRPVILSDSSTGDNVRRNDLLLKFGALVCGPLALLAFIVGMALAKDRLRALRIVAGVLAAWALVGVALAFVGPGMLAGTVVSQAARPFQEAAVHVLALRLATLCGVCLLVGVALMAVTTVVSRQRASALHRGAS